MSGLFITLEGGEGAGKTTQIQRLKMRLQDMGKTVSVTREPGGSMGAEAIRKLLVEGETHKWDALTETLLLFAARRDHLEKTIQPALDQGEWVLCDRFFDSTYAYQGYGLGLPLDVIDTIRTAAIGAFKPYLTFLLDVPVETGLARVTVQQRYERMDTLFHNNMRHGFLELAQKNSQRIVVIDASQPADMVEQAMWDVIKKRL